MKHLAIIPARGGSRGVPDKNLRPLLGRSLVERAFLAARESQLFDRIVLSTEDERIAELGSRIGLDVPFRRPPELATDEAPMIDVVLHAVDALAADDYRPDAVTLLQPTCPLRQPRHLRAAADLLDDNNSVCSVVRVSPELSPHYVMRIRSDGFLDFYLSDSARYARRQDVPSAYRRDGTVYLVTTQTLLQQRSLYGTRCVPLVLPPEESLSIDVPEDWAEAEHRLRSRSQ